MTSTYTSNKVYQKQGTGDNPNSWGTVLNTNVFDIIDKNMGGRLSISVAGSSNVTLTQSQADNIYHTMTGLLTGNIDYILPNQGGFFILKNSTTGSFAVTAKPSGGSGIAITQGSVIPIFVNPDTTAATALFDTLPSLTVTGALTSSGTFSAASVAVTGSSIPANGIYLPAANTLGLSARSLIAASFTNPASSVNYWAFSGSATGQSPTASLTGTDTNITGIYITKGTGAHTFATNASSTNIAFQIGHGSSSAVNYIVASGAATGLSPNFFFTGSDTNVSAQLSTKGTGSYLFYTNSGNQIQFQITHTPSSVNYWVFSGNTTGNPITITATGSDTNIGLDFFAKGTGNYRFFDVNSGNLQLFGIEGVASAANYIATIAAAAAASPQLIMRGTDTDITMTLTPKGAGDLRCAAVNSNTTASAANVNVDGSGNIRKSTSSGRFKRDIRNYEIDPEKIMLMRPVVYKSVHEYDGARDYAGFIAEEIDELGLKEFISYDDSGLPNGIHYPHMMALAVACMQNMQSRMEKLESQRLH